MCWLASKHGRLLRRWIDSVTQKNKLVTPTKALLESCDAK